VRRLVPLAAAFAAVAVLLPSYVALGGGRYDPTPVADPCQARELRDSDDLGRQLEQVVLSALDGAACDLGVSREELVLALRSEDSLDEFAGEHGISRAEAERAVADGIDRALEDAERIGALGGFAGSLIRRTLENTPPWLVLDVLETISALVPH
jgi:hypothetical protein